MKDQNYSKKNLYFNSDELLDLYTKKKVDIGNHTLSHKRLSLLDNKEIEKEIFINQKKLENLFGNIRYLAFPFGRLQDASPNAVSIGKKYVKNIF